MQSNGYLQASVFFALSQILTFPVASAADIHISPSLALAQHYTDNLFLENENLKEEDYVTEIDPGIGLLARGPRVGVEAHYVLQNLIYKNNDQFDTENHQFRGEINSELVKDRLFFNVVGSRDQQIQSTEQSISGDNVSIGNQTDVDTLSFNPHLVLDIGSLFLANMDYSYGIVKVEEGASDSVIDNMQADLTSGPAFSRLVWNLNYVNQKETRENDEVIRFEHAFFEARYKVFPSLSLLANIGYENSDYETSTGISNGTYRSFGLGWRPNRKIGLDATYGDEYQSAAVMWDPTIRTSLKVSWRETDIGINTGEIWQGDIRLKTKRAQWTVNYQEETATSQQLQLSGGLVDGSTDELGRKKSGFSLGFGLTDEVFIRKFGQLSFEYNRAKSDLTLSYFAEVRNFQESQIEQKIYGGSCAWKWRITSKTTIAISGGVQKMDLGTDDIVDNYKFGGLSMNWWVKRYLNTSLDYYYTIVESPIETREYEENRVILRINMTFSDSMPTK